MIAKTVARLPHSPQLRRIISSLYLLQGIGYFLVFIFLSPLTTSYQKQSEIMPIWAWSAMSLIVGVSLYFTCNRRHWIFGRSIAAIAACFAAWQLGTYIEAGAYTAIAQYGITLTVLIGEATFWDNTR